MILDIVPTKVMYDETDKEFASEFKSRRSAMRFGLAMVGNLIICRREVKD